MGALNMKTGINIAASPLRLRSGDNGPRYFGNKNAERIFFSFSPRQLTSDELRAPLA
jgi:hypothetical protein